MCSGNLSPVFDKFDGCEVSVVGRNETDGELFGDIAERCKVMGVPVSRDFAAAYISSGKVMFVEQFFARHASGVRYDELGLVRLRGTANEKPLVGLAMALHGQSPIPEDGSIKAEPMFFSGGVEIDV